MLAIPCSAVAAQATGANAIGGLRAYWHVFIAYAVVIVIVLGWVISIARRLKDVEQRLSE
jgi:CcmD family protein